MIAWLFSILMAISMYRLWRFRAGLRRSRKQKDDDSKRCPCGYDLSRQTILRCPECGRVVGFDATMEELGLSEQELLLATQRRREREIRKPDE